MGSAPSADEAAATGPWLARRLEFAPRDDEWETFHSKNHEHVPSLEGPVLEVRQIMYNTKMRGQSKTAPIYQGLCVQDLKVATMHGPLKLRTYTPQPEGGLPAGGTGGLLYFHGGGFALGDLDGEDRTCRVLCVNSRLVVVAVDYRLAPENPYPAALEDSWTALQWMVDEATALGVDPTKVLVGGTSAGANLAAVLALEAPARGLRLRGQLLRIPVTCQNREARLARGLHSMEEMAYAPILSRAAMEQFLVWYQPPSETDLTVSPLLAPPAVLAASCPAYFMLCGRDPLRDEGLAYADALMTAGVPVRVNVYSGVPHAFWIFPELAKTQTALKDMMQGVKWLLEESSRREASDKIEFTE